MKIELTVEEFDDLLTCVSCGVYQSLKWLTDARNDEFSTSEDIEHYEDVWHRIKALNQKLTDMDVTDMYGKNI